MKLNFFNKKPKKNKAEILLPKQKSEEKLKKAGLIKNVLTDEEQKKFWDKNSTQGLGASFEKIKKEFFLDNGNNLEEKK